MTGPDPKLLQLLAVAIMTGDPAVDQIVARCSRSLGRPWRWLPPLVRRFAQAFAGETRPRLRAIVEYLAQDKGLRRACVRYQRTLSVDRWPMEPPRMQPVPAASTWTVPVIETATALADWLQISAGDLAWFADLKGLTCSAINSRMNHYHYRVLPKRSGYPRLIEAPKPRLKALQQQILSGILAGIPNHDRVHGFVRDRSIKTFVAPHLGQRVVLRMDLRDFFPSFSAARIQALFRTAGYPESVADLLGGICTHATPRSLWNDMRQINSEHLAEARSLYSRPHLPQGAPSSPALANACAYRADCRLAGLAGSAGAAYTRYADDLAFSGDREFERGVEKFSLHIAAILMEEGFSVNHRKTRIMRQGVRQHLAGVVTNQHANLARPDFDRLKAILSNCVRLGPASQNRESHPAFRAHLEGRVAHVEMLNPEKAKRLRRLLDQIQWNQ